MDRKRNILKSSVGLVLLYGILALSPLAAKVPMTADRPVTREEKLRAVMELARLLRAKYAIAGTAEKAAETIEAKSGQGAYDTILDAAAFGEAVTADLRAVTGDKHLKFGLPSESSGAAVEGEQAFRQAEIRRGNFGLPRAEVLAGNVGLLEVRRFQAPDLAGDTIASAIAFLANVDAIIVDVRNCRGGSAYVMPVFAGYFLPRATSLFDLVFRGDKFTERFWTAAWLPGRRLAEVPMYILTSGYTFSGAEGFAYRFQVLKRATVVGETTGGGANAGGVLDVAPCFRVWMPMGRPIDVDTGTNWEGTGIVPDVKCPAREAPAVAHMEALKALRAKAAGDRERIGLDSAWERAEAGRNPLSLDPAALAHLAGTYGSCRVWVEGGQLRVQRANGPPFLLVALKPLLFVSETSEPVRAEFFADPEGAGGPVSRLSYTDEDGRREFYQRKEK